MSKMKYEMPNKDYHEMLAAIHSFKQLEGRNPSFYTWSAKNCRIMELDYNNTIRWFNDFKKKEGREPSTVIAYCEPITSPDSGKPQIWKDLEDAVGKFNNMSEFYNQLKKKDYKYYYNDVYPQGEAIKRLKYNKGLNCADISQLSYALAQVMNRKPTYWRGKFNCGGHIWITLDNSDYNKNVFDGAAAFKPKQYAQGKWLCSGNPVELVKNPKWLLSDDGKT
jgi:hypothetical protein